MAKSTNSSNAGAKTTKIYAQEDLKLSDTKTVRAGDVVLELPEDVTLEAIVGFAHTAKLSIEPPKPVPVIAPAAVTATAPAETKIS